jgi:hypothetical protein
VMILKTEDMKFCSEEICYPGLTWKTVLKFQTDHFL